jgi:hypothetical protein
MRATQATPGGEAQARIGVEAEASAPAPIQRSREEALPPSTPRASASRGSAERGSGARASQVQRFAGEEKDGPVASRMISAFEQQLGAAFAESATQQQAPRPEIRASIEQRGKA